MNESAAESAPRRSLALTLRLVAGYTLVALATLSVGGWFLHRGLLQSFHAEDADMLSGHIARLRADVRKRPADLHEAEEHISASADQTQVEKIYGTLLDSSGRVLLRSRGAEALAPPPEAYPAAVSPNEKLSGVNEWRSPGGALCFIAVAEVERHKGQPPLIYQVVMEATHVEAWMMNFRRQLMVVVGVGTLASSLLAWFITRRGLTPLRDITASVQRVTASGLEEQLGARAWPAELSTLAAEFDKMLARLRDSFERLSQFTADAAHEFRTPMNNLMGATSLTLSRDRTPDDYRRTLEANFEEYERLSRMVESLLFLARAEHAGSGLHKQFLDAVGAARSVIDFFSALAEEKDVTLTVSGVTALHADETLFRQALTNLVSNAIRHTPPGGHVSITLSTAADGGAIVAVQDTGSGISPGHLPYVFERFYRADASRTGSTSGAGLGLSLVQTLMTLHGGTVTAESESGQGSVFTLRFPPGTTRPLPAKRLSPTSSDAPEPSFTAPGLASGITHGL